MAQRIFEESSLKTSEYINLVAHYWGILNDVKDEEKVLLDRGFPQAYIDSIFTKKQSKKFEIAGLRFTKPLVKFNYPYLGYVLMLFENYQKGNLPNSGPVSQQPAQIMEIFSTIQLLRYEYQQIQDKQNAQPLRKRK